MYAEGLFFFFLSLFEVYEVLVPHALYQTTPPTLSIGTLGSRTSVLGVRKAFKHLVLPMAQQASLQLEFFLAIKASYELHKGPHGL